jgi:LacI family transcriptional regulator
MKRRPRVALLVETSNAYARGLLEGVTAYVRDHDPWSIYLAEQGRGAPPPRWLARWRGAGVIARIETAAIASAVARVGAPVVDLSAARKAPGAPWVETDDAAIARLALDHFLERGFRCVAFCGIPHFNWSKWRGENFGRLACEAGCECFAYESARVAAGQPEQARLRKWVRGLPKPVGVFACFDIQAQRLLDACRDTSVAVPEEVAVLGVDNDYLLCNLSSPPLSSVILDAGRAGYEAAALLDRMIAGEPVVPEAHLFRPLGIATRQSTDVLAIPDPDVAAALRLIREHACDGINVEDLLRAVLLSRRVFEERFGRVVGRTPHQEIMRVKLARARRLLAETNLPLSAIARQVGFSHEEYLSVVFKRETGQSPRAFRGPFRSANPVLGG